MLFLLYMNLVEIRNAFEWSFWMELHREASGWALCWLFLRRNTWDKHAQTRTQTQMHSDAAKIASRHNHNYMQTITITCIHTGTPILYTVPHMLTHSHAYMGKHPHSCINISKNKFWWLRNSGVQGWSTKWLCQCNLRMVPLLGISGFFFAITRNAISTHSQSTTGILVTTWVGGLGA